jgi:N-methylhydantoinase B
MDSTTISVIHNYLGSAAEEMRRTLIRTAFSPVIYEVLDFGISIYNSDKDLIADAPGLAFFLGANDYAVKKGIEHVGQDNLEPGDIILLNYPYWSSAHVADVALFAPVFDEGEDEPFAYTCIRAHWIDLGAKDPGYVLDSTDMHQEGLILPAIKVYKRGKADKEILDLIRFNSRLPENVLGDLEAQVAATQTGIKRLKQIRHKFGSEVMDTAMSGILDYGERITKKALLEIPNGSWEAEDFIDDDGVDDEIIPLRLRVTIEDEKFSVDFSKSPDAVRGPVNIPFGLTQTLCKVALKTLTAPTHPSNAGCFRPLEVIAPPGNIFHAVYPAATYTLWSAMVALELIFKALAQAMPDKIAACSGGDVPGFMMYGNEPHSGRGYAISNNEAVGWGAAAMHDGSNALNHFSTTMVRNTPVEVMEAKTGMQFDRVELRCDSGGAGRFRGGLGIRRDIKIVWPGHFLAITKKSKTAPWALDGGSSPEPNTLLLFPGTDKAKSVGTYRTEVEVGDHIVNKSAGGGGYGRPEERDPQRVLEDFLDGYVSIQTAKDIYKVIIKDQKVDLEATVNSRNATADDVA